MYIIKKFVFFLSNFTNVIKRIDILKNLSIIIIKSILVTIYRKIKRLHIKSWNIKAFIFSIKWWIKIHRLINTNNNYIKIGWINEIRH